MSYRSDGARSCSPTPSERACAGRGMETPAAFEVQHGMAGTQATRLPKQRTGARHGVSARSAGQRSRRDQEWLDALESVLEFQGTERANYLLERMSARMTETGAQLPYTITTPYRNTIPHTREARMPGDLFMERRIRSLIRWNALAMVMRANAEDPGIGGHIASFASSATLYDVGFNYFWRGPSDDHLGDLIYIQGHSAPGIYARSYLEGRLSEGQMDNFRQEVGGRWPALLSAPLAHEGLLAVPYGFHGPRSPAGDLPGARDEVSRRARDLPHGRSEDLGVSRRWRVR